MSCYFAKLSCVSFPTEVRAGQPIGIVIHYLSEDFSTVVNNQLLQTTQLANYDTAVGYHYVISHTGVVVELIAPLVQVPNLHAYTDHTWSEKPASGVGATDPDEITIHIALTNITLPCQSLTNQQNLNLVRVLCCLIEAFNTTISADEGSIILPYVIDGDQTDYYDGSALPEDLFTDIAACLSGDGEGDDEEENENSELITALTARVVTLEEDLEAAQTAITALEGQVEDLEEWQETISATVATLQTNMEAALEQVDDNATYLGSIKSCLDEVCPNVVSCGVVEYVLTQAGSYQLVNPNVNRRINFAEKVSDLIPPVVRVGPLWKANLNGGNYTLFVSARLSSAAYPAGAKVWLEMVLCSERTRIAEITLNAGTQTVELDTDDEAYDGFDGTLTIESACPDFHIEIGTDSVASGVKTMENASIVITPVI